MSDFEVYNADPVWSQSHIFDVMHRVQSGNCVPI